MKLSPLNLKFFGPIILYAIKYTMKESHFIHIIVNSIGHES
jgi:hypothetical protein